METKFSDLQFYNYLHEHNISLVFQGIISQDLLSLIGHSLKRRPDNEVVARRLFSIVIELAQNIYHYSAEKAFSERDNGDVGVGIIAVGETENTYVICSGNLIDRNKGDMLQERCKYINGLSPEELKAFYKEQRRQPQREDSPGANIGLIDIVRKAGNPLNCDIEPVSSMYSFLTFVVEIDKHVPMPE